MRYTFEWNPVKAKQNVRKHGISFERAAELFLDPLAVSVVDPEHTEAEEHWVTIGRESRQASGSRTHVCGGLCQGVEDTHYFGPEKAVRGV